MKIVTLTNMKQLDNVLFRPWTRFVVSEQEAFAIVQTENKKRLSGLTASYTDLRISSFNSYERRYGGQDANGKKIMLYRHKAYGDLLIASSIVRYIKYLYPRARIYVYCHKAMLDLWRGNAFIENEVAIPLPISLDAAQSYDWHICYEGMLESNAEPDQVNCYDSMFNFIGLDPPNHFKRPFIFLRPDDYAAIDYLRDRVDLDEKYLLYHLNPNNLNRSYPFPLSREFWEMFLEEFPNWKIYVVGLDEYFDPHSGQTIQNIRGPLFDGLPEDRVINLLSKVQNFRHYVPLIEGANLIVCPDSSISHLAACFPHVPVISLWGMFSPNDRVKYYPNHYPIWKPEICKLAPCHDHTFEIPEVRCRANSDVSFVEELSRGAGSLQWCPVLASITPEEILAKCKELVEGALSPRHQKYVNETGPPPIIDGNAAI